MSVVLSTNITFEIICSLCLVKSPTDMSGVWYIQTTHEVVRKSHIFLAPICKVTAVIAYLHGKVVVINGFLFVPSSIVGA